MTRVRILRNFPISPDGITVQTWQAGSERDVDDATLDILIGEGAVELIENKAMQAAPENKAIQAMPENKGKRGRRRS